MKALAVFISILGLIFLTSCDRDLKEHKVPPATLKKLEKKYDPALQAMQITGTISIPENQPNPKREGTVLFIFARPEGVDSGPPLAVKRISYFELPYEYAIGPADTMVPGVKFAGKMNLSVRLDGDGDTRARPGDLQGSVVAEPGQRIDIVLDQPIAAGGKSIQGTLTLDPGLKDKVPSGAVLFLFARPEGMAGGPPLAVKRISEFQFPYDFSIGQADTMMPDVTFDGAITLTARLDQDGSALGGPGDIEGRVSAKAGDTGVALKLDKVIGG